MVEFTRRNLLATSIAAAVGAGASGAVSAQADDTDTAGAPTIDGSVRRLSTTAHGAEVTGPFVFENGELLYSLQHPSGENPEPFGTAGVGVIDGFQFELNGRNDFEELSPPRSAEEQGKVRVSGGDYRLIAQNGDPIGEDGEGAWGIPETPEGTPLTAFAGTRYGAFGSNPDMNFFVSTDEEDFEGYLFTNVETSPGSVVRTPISRGDDGWTADLENAENLENTEAMRAIDGTRINCYGDLTPWETPVSAEEDYSHPRTQGPATVSEIVEAGSGVGLRGGAQFWNRPDPSDVGGALEERFGDDAWGPQGNWALTGLETLAYQLGAEPVDQAGGDGGSGDGSEDAAAGEENTLQPIGDGYPNPYRLGRLVEIVEPTAEDPTPVKHWAMGRAAWECPEFVPDERTVYLSSDGSYKGLYKFVAEEPIPEYDDRGDVRGTLYAVEVTNAEEAKNQPPADVDLEVDWLPLGTASNAEVEAWIAEYDDVTQVDYLETHAETDWQEDLEAALAEADRTVAEDGNRDYVTDEEIVEWVQQYEERGPDGVDEDLRKVPFLETRAAAKEIGATIEFRKAEGIDAHDDAGPGDFLYVGISELNDGMADERGEVRYQRVDGGLVYRAELDENYDVSTLEPAVVGPDASDPASVAEEAPINVDNVMVLDDGRVLLCEDADELGRSWGNDCLWVYEPPTFLGLDSVALSSGATGESTLAASTLPSGLSGGRLTVSVDHPEVARIEDVAYDGAIELTEEPEIADDGSSAELRVADVDDAVDATGSEVDLATVELRATGPGTTDLTVEVDALDDDAGAAIESRTRPAVVATGPPAFGGEPGDGTGSGAAPTDPDGDGLYEDVNGNGRMEYDDVVTLFEHVEDDAARMNEAAFDFNQNGRLDYDDVVSLYQEG